MQKQTKIKLGFLLIGSIIGFIVASCSILYIVHPTDNVINTWKQPGDIKYDSFGPYYLSVVEGGMDFSRFPFAIERRFYIYVGLDSGEPTYGHFVDYSFNSGGDDVVEHIKKSKVVWSVDGVTLKETSGHKVFVPESMLRGR